MGPATRTPGAARGRPPPPRLLRAARGPPPPRAGAASTSAELRTLQTEFDGLVEQLRELQERQERLRGDAEAAGLKLPTIVTQDDGHIVLQPPEARPLAGENVMNVVMVAAECAPWSKTGGLGDVSQALPKALAARGHRVMCVVPLYEKYEGVEDTGVRHSFNVCNGDQEVGYFHRYQDGVDWVFVDHWSFQNAGPTIYSGSREELSFRLALLSKAALESVWVVPCGGATYGDENLLFLANDWHTALLPVYLQAHYRDHGVFQYARCVLVIHNIAHQGRRPLDEFYALGLPEQYKELFLLDDPWGGECANVMKAGFLAAHRVVAVSKGYTWEVQTDMGGWGLAPTLRDHSYKLTGVVNGIDLQEWDPRIDVHLRSDGYANFDPAGFQEGKAACKRALQREMGLAEDARRPLLVFIGRLDEQKGVDLIRDCCQQIVARGAQMVLLGSGREDLEEDLRRMESENRESCRCYVGFSVELAHRLTAAGDILMMPSRFEPCGLNQLYAMRYGTVPVVHAVGGLRDTVHQYDPHTDGGTGWHFTDFGAEGFMGALDNAVTTFYDFPDAFADIQRRGMRQDLGWAKAAEEYEQVLVEAKYQW